MAKQWRWERRDERKQSQKNAMIMHGKGLKRVENDLENRNLTGTIFTDPESGRKFEVKRRDDDRKGLWVCYALDSIEVLYYFKEKFIIDNKD